MIQRRRKYCKTHDSLWDSEDLCEYAILHFLENGTTTTLKCDFYWVEITARNYNRVRQ